MILKFVMRDAAGAVVAGTPTVTANGTAVTPTATGGGWQVDAPLGSIVSATLTGAVPLDVMMPTVDPTTLSTLGSEDLPTDYAKPEDVQITVPEPVFAGTVTFSGTVEAPAVTVNPTLTPEESAKLLGAAQEATLATIPTAEHNAEAVDARLSAIHGAGSWEGGVPTEGVLITQDSIGDDDLLLGPIMPYGTLSVYLGEDLAYVFDKIGDANGNFAITLPYGATWTLVATNPPHYRTTTAIITTPPQP